MKDINLTVSVPEASVPMGITFGIIGALGSFDKKRGTAQAARRSARGFLVGFALGFILAFVGEEDQPST